MEQLGRSTAIRTCRCSGISATICGSRARGLAAARDCAARARCTWTGGSAVVPDTAPHAAEQARDHDRRPQSRRTSPGAARLGDAQRGAVRLLPVGADHAGRVAAGTDPESHRSGHRSRHGRQHLPLRHLPADPRRHQDCGEGAGMSAIENVSRRRFIGGMFSTGAFVLAARVLPDSAWAQSAAPAFRTQRRRSRAQPERLSRHPARRHGLHRHASLRDGHRHPHDAADGGGRRARRRLEPRTIEQGIGDARYGDQNTDGSRSIRDFYDAFRQAGASARTMLVSAAAAQWNVPAAECTTQNHEVVHQASGRRLGYGALVPAAAKLPVPKAESLQFKPKTAWRFDWQGDVDLRPAGHRHRQGAVRPRRVP